MTLLVEDAARSGMRLAMLAVSPPNPSGPTPLLMSLPEHLHEKYVRPLVAAETTMCFALTKPAGRRLGCPSHPHERCAGDGRGSRINGHKHYITNGDKADVAIVFAVTDAEKRAAGGITAFLVPGDQITRGPVQWNISDTHPSELYFNDAWVPADHVLGEPGVGFFLAMAFLNAGRAFIGAEAWGWRNSRSTRPSRTSPPVRRSDGRFPSFRRCRSRWPSQKPTSRRCVGWRTTWPGASTKVRVRCSMPAL